MPITALGLTTGDFANRLQDLPACLDRFEALGADYAELSLGAFDVIADCRILPERLRELKRICADRPLGYTLHGPLVGRFTSRRQLQAQIDVCRAALDLCGEIGATAQVHHGGSGPLDDRMERDRVFALERETLAALGPHAADCGVLLCVENLYGDEAYFMSPAELAAQIEAVDHPNIRATVDFSHAALNAGARGFDLMAELAILAPLAGHLHIHDSFGKPRSFKTYTYGEGVNFGMGDLHLPPGWGGLDWEAIAALDYRADVVANLELSMRFESALPEAVARCREMIEISREAASRDRRDASAAHSV
ncbi:MAG: sugar phosphate isomerase/epimerase [Pseudomonadota bacterium]